MTEINEIWKGRGRDFLHLYSIPAYRVGWVEAWIFFTLLYSRLLGRSWGFLCLVILRRLFKRPTLRKSKPLPFALLQCLLSRRSNV
jgi:hypothetical protein